MEIVTKLQHHLQPLYLSFNQNRPSASNSFSSLFFAIPHPPSSPSIRVSCSSSTSSSYSFQHNLQKPRSQFFKSLYPLSCTFIILTSIATTTLLFSRFHPKNLIPRPISLSVAQTDKDSTLQEIVAANILEFKHSYFQSIWLYKLQVQVERTDSPTESKIDNAWKLLKNQIYSYINELELARIGFEKLLAKDPFQRRAYHGKLIENLEMIDELKDLLGSVKDAMDTLDEDKKKFYTEVKNMVRRIRALENKTIGTLKYYQDLEEEQ